jgi:hypothetical protein
LVLEYREFLKLPEVECGFDTMFTERKEYYRQKCSSTGFDKEHLELFSIKMAFMETDIFFTEIHNSGIKKSSRENS